MAERRGRRRLPIERIFLPGFALNERLGPVTVELVGVRSGRPTGLTYRQPLQKPLTIRLAIIRHVFSPAYALLRGKRLTIRTEGETAPAPVAELHRAGVAIVAGLSRPGRQPGSRELDDTDALIGRLRTMLEAEPDLRRRDAARRLNVGETLLADRLAGAGTSWSTLRTSSISPTFRDAKRARRSAA